MQCKLYEEMVTGTFVPVTIQHKVCYGDFFKRKDTMKPMMYFEKAKQKNKRMKKIVLFCIAAVGLCGCKKIEEIPSSISPAPVITEAPEQKEIPIDAEHFTDEIFREYISGMYDLDKNGALSQAEREAVKEMEWEIGYWAIEKGSDDWLTDKADVIRHKVRTAVLDGLEYFPKLEDLRVYNAKSVVLKNHPSIQEISGDEGRIETVLIENCPMLERMAFGLFEGDFSVRNCERLRLASFGEAELGTLIFEETPQLVLYLCDTDAEDITMDANAVISMEGTSDIRILGTNYGEYTKDGRVSFGMNERIHWQNADESSVIMKEKFALPQVSEDDFSYVDVRISEKEDETAPETGEKAWEIAIHRNELTMTEYDVNYYTVYAKEKPERSQIVLRPIGGVSGVSLNEYSPNKGVFFRPQWKFEVVYRDGDNEEVLGTFRYAEFWNITPDGTLSRYRYGVDRDLVYPYWKETHVYQACIDLGVDPTWYYVD